MTIASAKLFEANLDMTERNFYGTRVILMHILDTTREILCLS